ncbi:nitroreductase family protein [Thermotoga sp. KOL6]|uniref:nitroreductase family protein n=1 Tax=Thermotoga sp. KOL6 TaxID=126741 RepID=UPI000C78C7B9|nr:nitroreductase family protein [Thermotoga sp. KOL6]PLV58715.1 NADH oxidase [Thermotoga sp. KOL6]
MLYELAKRRKTVRKFKKEKPPIEDVLYSVKVANEAPSGMNAQPWHFLLIESPQKKKQIREVCEKAEKCFYEKVRGKLKEWLSEKNFSWRKPFLEEAPYLLLVFSQKGAPYSRESVWLAIGYLLLALEEKKLGSVPYTPPNLSEVAKLVNAPESLKLEVILPIGYPDDPKPKYPRNESNLKIDTF